MLIPSKSHESTAIAASQFEQMLAASHQTNALLQSLIKMQESDTIPILATKQDKAAMITLISPAIGEIIRLGMEKASTGMLLAVGFGHNLDLITAAPANYSGYDVDIEPKINGALIPNWGTMRPTLDFQKSTSFNDLWKMGIPLKAGDTITVEVTRNATTVSASYWARIILWSVNVDAYEKKYNPSQWSGLHGRDRWPGWDPYGGYFGGDDDNRQEHKDDLRKWQGSR